MNLTRSLQKRLHKIRLSVSDPASMTLDEQTLGDFTRRDESKPLTDDRLQELMDYYETDEATIRATQDADNTQAKAKLFDGDLSSDKALFDAYRDSRMTSNTRHMLAYTRFGPASKIVRYINSLYPPARRKQTRVLDYGCGVSDYGLAFTSQGYAVTIADIAGGNLEFARWRHAQRKLSTEVIEITEDNLYPDLGQFDIVISGEVFEHIRDPLQLIANMHRALSKGGLLWHSGYPEDPREVGGAHLPEAAEARDASLKFLRLHFKSATEIQLPGYLYSKR